MKKIMTKIMGVVVITMKVGMVGLVVFKYKTISLNQSNHLDYLTHLTHPRLRGKIKLLLVIYERALTEII